MITQEMNICLWFNNQAEEAARFYTSIFQDAEMGPISRFGKEGFEYHGQPAGTAMTVGFRLNQMKFIALNGGPKFKFNEAVSIVVYCTTQQEIDHYWTNLTAAGGEESPCGWLKDKYSVSWQITPAFLPAYLTDKDLAKKNRVEEAAFKMKKFEIEKLKNAYEGR